MVARNEPSSPGTGEVELPGDVGETGVWRVLRRHVGADVVGRAGAL